MKVIRFVQKFLVPLSIYFFLLSVTPFNKTVFSAGYYDEAIDYYEKPFKVKSLNGVVLINTETENVISGARVTITDEKFDKKIEETITDEKGFFSLPNKKKGIYYLQIFKSGFHIMRLKVKISKKKKISESLVLKMNLS